MRDTDLLLKHTRRGDLDAARALLSRARRSMDRALLNAVCECGLNSKALSLAFEALSRGPARITRRGDIYSTPALKDDDCERLRAQGLPQRAIDALLPLAHESTWPARLRTLEGRDRYEYAFYQFLTHVVAELPRGRTLLHVPTAKNDGLGDGVSPAEDFFIVIKSGSISRGLEQGGRVNLNTATLDDLRKLPSIGDVRGRAILAERTRLDGAFERPSDLLLIEGIGPALLKRIGPLIEV